MKEATARGETLRKNLTLFDVYAISTGAMFSSGFFLLPGIAASYTGPSVFLAYLAAGFLILPSMLCMAELATAMPKAGGTYYFLDRSLGPLMGTIGGLGSWVAVIFKSAFALVGMGAYLALYLDVPITLLAVILTLAFGALNVFGAKETTLLQRILVSILVVILSAFVIQGLAAVGAGRVFRSPEGYDAFFRSGMVGFVATIGLVCDRLEQPELVVYRSRRGVELDASRTDEDAGTLRTLFFLITPRRIAGLDLRLAGHLAEIVGSRQFERDWLDAGDDRELREILVRDDHFLHAPIEEIPRLAGSVGRELREVDVPGSCLVALVERGGRVLTAKGGTVLRAGDELAIIGEPEDLEKLRSPG